MWSAGYRIRRVDQRIDLAGSLAGLYGLYEVDVYLVYNKVEITSVIKIV